MARIARLIRRTVRAAATTSRHLLHAAVSRSFRTLTALYRAIDTSAAVRIRYTDEDGVQTARTIRPERLWISDKGHIVCTAHDQLRDARRTFRTDRMTIQPEEAPAMTPTLTKDAVTLHDIETRKVWRTMSHRAAESDLYFARSCGDTIQEYATTDRQGRPLRVVLQVDAPREYANPDHGGIYEFAI